MSLSLFDRVGEIENDARLVRRRIASLSPTPESVGLPPLTRHLYPRSFAYNVRKDGSGTEVTMYGSNSRGETMAVRATGFRPYMFVRLKPENTLDDARIFVEQLNRALLIVSLQRSNGCIGYACRATFKFGGCDDTVEYNPVCSYDIVDAVSLKPCGADRGYNGGSSERFIQIFMYSPSLVRATRDLLEHVYDERDSSAVSDMQFVNMLVSAVRDARARTELSTPDMDVKGNVRETGKPLKPTQQKLVDASASMAKLAQSATLGPVVTREEVVVEDDGDVNVWNDPDVNEALFGSDEDESVVDPVDDNEVSAADALRAEEAEADEDEEEKRRRERVTLYEPRARRAFSEFVAEALRSFGGDYARSLRLRDGVAATPVEVYEADVDFTLRFAIDAGFKAEECVVVDGPTAPFALGSGADGGDRSTTLNDDEFACDWRSLRRCPIEGYQNRMPPQVCASFDIETETGPDGRFPKPESERVLQICCVFFDPVADPLCLSVVRRAFVLGDVDLQTADNGQTRFDGDEVYSFREERDMLVEFTNFMRALQPDMVTGWNIENFDFNYILERAETIGCAAEVAAMSRRPGAGLRVSERSFSSSAHGTHVYKEVRGEGLWVWDLFQVFKRSTSFKLRSYSLEYVSTHFLKDRKDDVAYSAINRLQTTPEGRFKLMRYCMKDALLPARLIGHLTLLIESIELSRATGVPLDMIARRGLQVRLKSLLYRHGRYTKPERLLFYTRTAADRLASVGSSYSGGHVETPEVGYHDEVIITVDYKSLYPSIMVTKNMCLSTLLPGRSLDKRARTHGFSVAHDTWPPERNALPGDREDQPSFLRSSHTPGVIPRILLALLAQRKRVKRLMADAETAGDKLMQAVYDKRQLAIKLNCNAIYGVFGAPSSFAYNDEMAATTTATGRDIILESKELIETTFTVANGYPFNARGVYGDTDSIFVKLSVVGTTTYSPLTIEQAAEWGTKIAAFVTEHYERKYTKRVDNIIELEFEKAYSKLLLYAKKRYVGLKWQLKFDKELGCMRMICKAEPDASGMETERRDSCLLVSKGVGDVLRMLLSSDDRRSNLERVREYIVNEMIAPLETGTIEWNELIQSKQFRMRIAEYTNRGQTPPIHIVTAAKLDQRLGAGSAGTYVPGDRVQYVVVDEQRPGQKTSECGEDPDYAWHKRLRLSRRHYLENGIRKTMVRVLEPVLLGSNRASHLSRFAEAQSAVDVVVVDDDGAGDDDDDIKAIKDRAERAQARKRRREAEREYDLFIRAKKPRRQVVTSSVGASAGAGAGLAAFSRSKMVRCRLCGAPAGSTICARHDANERALYDDERASKRQRLDVTRDELWRVCVSCTQGWRAEDDAERAATIAPMSTTDIESIEVGVPCKNSTCDIYWRRRLNDRLHADSR